MASETKSWRQTAMEYQVEMCANFGDIDWDVYEKNELCILKEKVKVVIFGATTDNTSQKNEMLVNHIWEAIKKEGTHRLGDTTSERATYMAFIFLFGTDNGKNLECWPVFKVPKNDTGLDAIFIDLNCRVYKSWNDFLENNKLPAHEYCYPKDGKYVSTSDCTSAVEFGRSPRTKWSKKILNIADITSTGVAFGASMVTLASICVPVAGSLLAASTWAVGGVSAYTAVRSSKTLHDRRTHKQSIGLGDREARNCYVSILGSTLGFGASAATTVTARMVQNGCVVGDMAASAVTALNGGALVMNGVGIVHGLHYLVEKGKDGHLTVFDVAQFSASLLLFCHATVKFQTARSIIEKLQNGSLHNFENGLGSRWKRIVFRTAVRCVRIIHGENAGKALVIRSIRHINNADDYFASMLLEDELLCSNRAVIMSQNNISQMHCMSHLDTLLTPMEKVELKELLTRYSEPFQRIILQLSNSLFQAMENIQSIDFIHFAYFVGELVHGVMTLIFKGEREYVLSMLRNRIRNIPSANMSNCEYCLAIFEELVSNPTALYGIYNLVKSFYIVLLDRTKIPEQCHNVDFIQLISACSILLQIDKPKWELIVDFAKSVFDSLNLRKFSSLMKILKELLLYIQQSICNMQRRYQLYRYESSSSTGHDAHNDYQLARAIDTLFEDEIHRSFTNRFSEENLDENSEEVFPLMNLQPRYTREQPLILRKSFQSREQLELLTREEILDISKQTLRLDSLTSNCTIRYEGLQITVSIDNTEVVIVCDLENETILSYTSPPASSGIQTL